MPPAGSSGDIARRISSARGSLDEKECFAPGDELESYSVGGFQLGLSICYDLRFPEIYRD